MWCDLLAAVTRCLGTRRSGGGHPQEWVGHRVVHLYQLKGIIQTHDEDNQVSDLYFIEYRYSLPDLEVQPP